MGIGSKIVTFFKWIDRARKFSERLDELDKKLEKQDSDIKDLSNLCSQMMNGISMLESRYENISEKILTEIENKYLKSQLGKLLKAKRLPRPRKRRKKKK